MTVLAKRNRCLLLQGDPAIAVMAKVHRVATSLALATNPVTVLNVQIAAIDLNAKIVALV
jgi:hypothetical protein